MARDEVIKQRLNTITGHLKGIQRMVEEGAYCIDIISQIHAVQSALNKVSTIILDDHLKSCLITAVKGDDPEERERVLQEIVDVFETTSKV
ncbi:MAG: metal-sensitive transcriptional regulator [Anaerolineales bacterium]